MRRLLIALAATVAAAGAHAATPSLSIDVTPVTTYVWRGIPLTDGPALQLGYTLEAAGVSFNVWENVDLDNANGRTGEVTEHDYTLGATFKAGKHDVSLALLYYTFPGSGDPTTELVAGVTFDAPWKPSVTLYQDLDDYKGLYVSAGATAGVELGARMLDLSFAVGYGTAAHNAYYGVDKACLTDVLLTASSTFEFGEAFSITPALSFASVLDGEIVDAFKAKNLDAGRAVFGVTLAYIF